MPAWQNGLMKKLMGLFLLCGVAASQPEFLRLGSLQWDTPPGTLVVRIEIENTRPYDATDVRLRVEAMGKAENGVRPTLLTREEALKASLRGESKRVMTLKFPLKNEGDVDFVNVSVVSANFKGY